MPIRIKFIGTVFAFESIVETITIGNKETSLFQLK